jgi:putative ABC transport system substrate-binding protein
VRRAIIRVTVVVALSLFAEPLATEAQVGKVPRIGVLLPGSPEPEYERRLDAFRQGLREQGYSEKQNILVEYRWAETQYDRFPALVAELMSLKVDVLVIDSMPAARAAKDATTTVPIVLAVAGDPVGTGLVRSLARPGGNITGTSLMTRELSAKRLAILKEAVPALRRVAVLLNPANPTHAFYWRELQAAAPSLDVKIQAVEVRGSNDLARALATVTSWQADGLFVLEDPLLLPAHQTDIVAFAARHRLPTISGLRTLADAGGLMSFGASFPDLFRQAATLVVKILKGARPADLPVEQPTKFELVINLRTARALGLTVPPPLLLRADQVLE